MAAETPSQTVGPYFSLGLFVRDAAEVVPAGAPGAIRVSGCVRDGEGEPVSDAMVEVWQADEEGRYRPDFGWARSACDAAGRLLAGGGEARPRFRRRWTRCRRRT